MEKLTTTLLTGAAMSALAVAPATAGGHHFVVNRLVAKTAKGVIVLNNIPFKKTMLPGKVKYTYTCTWTTHLGCYSASFYSRYKTYYGLGANVFDSSGARSTWLKQVHDLPLADTWESGACTYHSASNKETCYFRDSPNSKWKATPKASHGRVKAYSQTTHRSYHYTYSTGFVINEYTTLTWRGPAYELRSSTASSDSFTWNNSTHTTYTYTCTNSKGKKKMCKEEFIDTAKVNNSLSFF